MLEINQWKYWNTILNKHVCYEFITLECKLTKINIKLLKQWQILLLKQVADMNMVGDFNKIVGKIFSLYC